jgi:hypothetical protein
MLMRNRTLQGSLKPSFQNACYQITSRKQIFTYHRIFPNDLMFISSSGKVVISTPSISSNDASRFNCFFHCKFKAFCGSIRNASKTDPSKSFAVLLCGDENQCFSARSATTLATVFFTANKGFINFDNTTQTITALTNHSTTKFMQPCPCGFVTAQTDYLLKTFGAGTAFLTGDPPYHSKPDRQRFPRSFKDRSCSNRCFIRT